MIARTASPSTDDILAKPATTNAALAAAVAAFILAEEEMWTSQAMDVGLFLLKFEARETAFNRLKTIFETEFPHV